MDNHLIFNFTTDLSRINISKELNNPFGLFVPQIAQIAAQEFQQFIARESQGWKHDFRTQKGKMFGILVVQKEDESYGYLGTVSGQIPGGDICNQFIPSIFNNATDDFFINKGMKELTEMGSKIKNTKSQAEIILLKENRRKKSVTLQKRLFENYRFLNILGIEKNVLQIFKHSSHGSPPSAAGECTAPKLLQYALKHNLKPIALREFWWGHSNKNKERKHKEFYPACKNKCRPILEYMLDDMNLFKQANAKK